MRTRTYQMTLSGTTPKKISYVAAIFAILAATFLLPSLLDAWQSDGYVADRRYKTEIVAIRDIPRRQTRFAMIVGADGRNIYLTDPQHNFRRCKIGDSIEYRMDGQIKLRDKFIYVTDSCIQPR